MVEHYATYTQEQNTDPLDAVDEALVTAKNNGIELSNCGAVSIIGDTRIVSALLNRALYPQVVNKDFHAPLTPGYDGQQIIRENGRTVQHVDGAPHYPLGDVVRVFPKNFDSFHVDRGGSFGTNSLRTRLFKGGYLSTLQTARSLKKGIYHLNVDPSLIELSRENVLGAMLMPPEITEQAIALARATDNEKELRSIGASFNAATRINFILARAFENEESLLKRSFSFEPVVGEGALVEFLSPNMRRFPILRNIHLASMLDEHFMKIANRAL